MIRILTEPKQALVKQYAFLFAMEDVAFHVTTQALGCVARMALDKKTGARGLRSILEQALKESMYLVPDDQDVNAVVLDARPVVEGETEALE
jgi:ATP-dependent Clp protease ATP-binding subunit ClpX